MCFNQPMSFGMAAFGLLCSVVCWYKTANWKLTAGTFFFFTMEFLQGIQYWYIDECDDTTNKVLTMLGMLHICFQPFFTHLMTSALVTDDDKVGQGKYKAILGMCLAGAVWLMWRVAMAPYAQYHPTAECPTTEWLRGVEWCTFSGDLHLSWSVPMYDATYFSPGASVHSFLMFAPFLVVSRPVFVLGLFLFLSGPLLASYITSSLFEQASIWCFYSCTQVFVMALLFRFQDTVPDHLDADVVKGIKKKAE